jgi:hypothetical protein
MHVPFGQVRSRILSLFRTQSSQYAIPAFVFRKSVARFPCRIPLPNGVGICRSYHDETTITLKHARPSVSTTVLLLMLPDCPLCFFLRLSSTFNFRPKRKIFAPSDRSYSSRLYLKTFTHRHHKGFKEAISLDTVRCHVPIVPL